MCESVVQRMHTVYLNTIANQVAGFASALWALKVRINQRAFTSVACQARRDERLPPLVTAGLVLPLAPRRLARSPLRALQRFGSSKRAGTSRSHPNIAGLSGNSSLTGVLVLIQDCESSFLIAENLFVIWPAVKINHIREQITDFNTISTKRSFLIPVLRRRRYLFMTYKCLFLMLGF